MGHKNVKGLILQEYKKTKCELDSKMTMWAQEPCINMGNNTSQGFRGSNLYQHGQQHFSRCQGGVCCINMGNNTSQGVRGGRICINMG